VPGRILRVEGPRGPKGKIGPPGLKGLAGCQGEIGGTVPGPKVTSTNGNSQLVSYFQGETGMSGRPGRDGRRGPPGKCFKLLD
jgi:hypothetical protein